jgi:DNA-binding transcriptional ArsR family regulator
MGYSVQIAPVGFEFKRILAGIKYRPCNMVYLLTSQITQKNEFDEKLVKLSQEFTDRLVSHLNTSKTYEVISRDCSFIDYQTIIQNLCIIFKEIFKREDEFHIINEISINIGTATKLFVAAAMYLSSFFSNKIKLFYTNAKKYTINLLLDDKKSKKDILEIYKNEGMSYSDEDLKEYNIVEVPVSPIEKCPESVRNIILALNQLSANPTHDWVKLQEILIKLGENDDQSTKMKYRYHFKFLLDRNLIEENKHGKLRRYRFSDSGKILATILSELNEYLDESKS